MTAYTFHSDPAHGWLEIGADELRELGVPAMAISRFSYVDLARGRLYLEEDCDAPKFLQAYKAKHGAEPEIVEKHTKHDSPIRSLRNYWA